MSSEIEVRDVFKESLIEGNTLYLPKRVLPRKLYEAVNAVLVEIGGKWDKKAKGHVFAGNPREALNTILGQEKLPEKKTGLDKNPDAFWATPRAVIDILFELSDIKPGLSYAEPQSGEGAICDALVDAGVPKWNITCFEKDEGRANICLGKGYNTETCDFLTKAVDRRFDRIIMNPPFSAKGNPTVYVEHVRHAWEFLAPGGILTSVVPGSYPFRSDKKVKGLRDFIESHGGSFTEIPAKAFKESGTGVNTVIISVKKPA